jgi:uncharacterized membrane protein
MKKWLTISFIILLLVAFSTELSAQCAMCTKTAQQLGEKPAAGMNAGILYLMMAPFTIVGFIAYRWWKNNKQES